MFEGHSVDHLKSKNQQAFGVATLSFWLYQLSGFLGYLQSFEKISNYMFEGPSFDHL